MKLETAIQKSKFVRKQTNFEFIHKQSHSPRFQSVWKLGKGQVIAFSFTATMTTDAKET